MGCQIPSAPEPTKTSLNRSKERPRGIVFRAKWAWDILSKFEAPKTERQVSGQEIDANLNVYLLHAHDLRE